MMIVRERFAILLFCLTYTIHMCDAKSCKGRSCDIRMPLLNNMKAPLVAELDVSEVNRELKQFIEISINSTYNENIEEMIIKNLEVHKSMMLKEYSDEQNRTKRMYDIQIVNIMDSLKARQGHLQTELKEYSSNLSISAEYFDQKLIDLVRDVEGKFDSMFLNMTSHYKQKVNILSDRLNKEFVDFQLSTEEWKNNITHTSSEIIGPLYEAANGKVAKQSSLHHSKQFPASLALDGNTGTFSHTNAERNPSWWVDLGRLFRVVRIDVYSRRECCGSYLHDMDVTVGPSLNSMSLCTHYKGPAKTGEHLVLECEATMVGRFVKLSIIGNGIMQLAELKVFAYYHN